jgi:hypothetical protein
LRVFKSFSHIVKTSLCRLLARAPELRTRPGGGRGKRRAGSLLSPVAGVAPHRVAKHARAHTRDPAKALAPAEGWVTGVGTCVRHTVAKRTQSSEIRTRTHARMHARTHLQACTHARARTHAHARQHKRQTSSEGPIRLTMSHPGPQTLLAGTDTDGRGPKRTRAHAYTRRHTQQGCTPLCACTRTLHAQLQP